MDENIIKMDETVQVENVTNKELIPVKDFVTKYKGMTSEKAKDLYLKSIIKDEYIPILVKQFWARQIITGANFDKDGRVYFDGAKQYLSYIYAVLNLYTKLDVPTEGFNFYFDMLNEIGVVEKLETILPKDFKKFQSIYKIIEDDFRSNHAVTHINVEDIGTQVEMGVLNGVNKVMELISSVVQDEQLMGEIQKAINQNQDN